MLKKLTVITLLSTTILTGCGKKAPKCSDERVINLVIQIAKEQFPTLPKLQEAEATISAIRTIEHSKETGSYTCKGKITFTSQDEDIKPFVLPITYQSENTDDGKEYYVSVINFNE